MLGKMNMLTIDIGDIVDFQSSDGTQGRGRVIAEPQPAVLEVRTGKETHLCHMCDCEIVFKAP